MKWTEWYVPLRSKSFKAIVEYFFPLLWDLYDPDRGSSFSLDPGVKQQRAETQLTHEIHKTQERSIVVRSPCKMGIFVPVLYLTEPNTEISTKNWVPIKQTQKGFILTFPVDSGYLEDCYWSPNKWLQCYAAVNEKENIARVPSWDGLLWTGTIRKTLNQKIIGHQVSKNKWGYRKLRNSQSFQEWKLELLLFSNR